MTNLDDVLKMDPPAPELLAAAVRANPFSREVLRRCMQAAGGGDPQRGLDWAVAVHESSEIPLYAVMLEYAAANSELAVRKRFGTAFAKREAAAVGAFGRAWNNIIEGKPPAPEDAAFVNGRYRDALLPFLHFVQPRPRQVNLLRRTARDEATLTSEGIDPRLLDSFLAEFLKADPLWSRALDAASLPSAVARERVAAVEARAGWMDRALAEGRLRMVDPIGGQVTEAMDSLVAFGRGIYLFQGAEPFVLLTGGYWNEPLGLMLPRRALILTFDPESRSLLSGEPLNNLRASLIRHRSRPVPAMSERGAGFTLYLPPTDNFAHQLWNYQSAIERCIRLGWLGALRAVRFSGTEFFGSLTELFPELEAVRVERPRREATVDVAPRDASGLVIKAGGFFIPRSLTDRIIALMRRRPRARPDAVEPGDVPRPKGAPVVWLALRVRGRAWEGQEAGFVDIIRYIAERAPDAVFLIDGFSYPVSEDVSTAGWADAVAALKGMAERIRIASPDPARVVNMVGNTMRESVLWATETDAYLAPYGSTQHKVAWFTDAPGLVYAPPAISEAIAMRSPGFAAAEISALPTLVHGEAATPSGDGIGPARKARASTVNLHLDAGVLAAKLWVLLEERIAAKARG